MLDSLLFLVSPLPSGGCLWLPLFSRSFSEETCLLVHMWAVRPLPPSDQIEVLGRERRNRRGHLQPAASPALYETQRRCTVAYRLPLVKWHDPLSGRRQVLPHLESPETYEYQPHDTLCHRYRGDSQWSPLQVSWSAVGTSDDFSRFVPCRDKTDQQ